MRYIFVFLVMVSFVSCGKSSKGSGSNPPVSSSKSPVIEDTLNKVYHEIFDIDAELVKKMEFYDNDTVKVTHMDNSSEVFKQENIDEGVEDDVDLLLENICSGTGSGDTKFIDIKLKKSSDNSFVANLGAEVWEGTCNGQEVSCAAMLVYDVDPVVDGVSSPVQGYIFGLNDEDGCDPIQSEIEVLLSDLFE